jgi:hypothetical protein
MSGIEDFDLPPDDDEPDLPSEGAPSGNSKSIFKKPKKGSTPEFYTDFSKSLPSKILGKTMSELAVQYSTVATTREMRRIVRIYWRTMQFYRSYKNLLERTSTTRKSGKKTEDPYVLSVLNFLWITMKSQRVLFREYSQQTETGRWAVTHVPGIGNYFTSYIISQTWDAIGSKIKNPEQIGWYINLRPKTSRPVVWGFFNRHLSRIMEKTMCKVIVFSQKEPWLSFYRRRWRLETERNEAGHYRKIAQKCVEKGYLDSIPKDDPVYLRYSSGKLSDGVLLAYVRRMIIRVFFDQFYTVAMLEKGKRPIEPYPVRNLGIDPVIPIVGIDEFLDRIGTSPESIDNKLIRGPFRIQTEISP